jgi:hypothetical protein
MWFWYDFQAYRYKAGDISNPIIDLLTITCIFFSLFLLLIEGEGIYFHWFNLKKNKEGEELYLVRLVFEKWFLKNYFLNFPVFVCY